MAGQIKTAKPTKAVYTEEVVSAVLSNKYKSIAKFHLLYHPMRYFWAGKEYGWLPDLGQMILEPGVGGFDTGRGDTRAILNADTNGYRVLKIEQLPKEFQDCVDIYNTPSGKRHVFKWVSYKISGNKTLKKVDNKMRLDFLKKLIDRGVLDPLEDELEEHFISEMEAELSKAERRSSLKPLVIQLKEKVERLRTELKEIKELRDLRETST